LKCKCGDAMHLVLFMSRDACSLGAELAMASNNGGQDPCYISPHFSTFTSMCEASQTLAETAGCHVKSHILSN